MYVSKNLSEMYPDLLKKLYEALFSIYCIVSIDRFLLNFLGSLQPGRKPWAPLLLSSVTSN